MALSCLSVADAAAQTALPPNADGSSVSRQILQNYFDTAGVCTTSDISRLRDDGDVITIEIIIESNTRRSLAQVLDHERDNWFSLHCPPEVHAVWRQPHPPGDILITGMLEGDESFTLSCVDYQRENQWGVRRVTIRDKIVTWLQDRLPN